MNVSGDRYVAYVIEMDEESEGHLRSVLSRIKDGSAILGFNKSDLTKEEKETVDNVCSILKKR